MTLSFPKIHEFSDQKIFQHNIPLPLYPTIYPTIFYISRSYRGKHDKKLIALLRKKPSKPLDQAIRLGSLLNLGLPSQKIKTEIEKLAEEIPSVQPFCIDPAINHYRMYNGSIALTAAISAYTINHYLEKIQEEREATNKRKEQRIIECIKKAAWASVDEFPAVLRSSFKKILNQTVTKDSRGEITLLPVWWNAATGRRCNEQTLELGRLNLFGWIVYRIYDNLLDADSGTNLLPLANLLLQKTTLAYAKAFPTKYFSVFQEMMASMEKANAWEAAHCKFTYRKNIAQISGLPRYRNYSIIAEKSMGHALGPLALNARGRSPHRTLPLTKKFFLSYLTAKQLNDDAHDWRKDLERGLINPASALLLRQWKKHHGNFSFDRRNDLPLLEKLFWKKTLPGVCRKILENVNAARSALTALTSIKDRSRLEHLLLPLEKSAHKALRDRQNTLNFINHYKKTKAS